MPFSALWEIPKPGAESRGAAHTCPYSLPVGDSLTPRPGNTYFKTPA